MKYLLIAFMAFSLSSFSQKEFTNPLDIPMYLSGSFAELRSNHFHSGIDIKTNETIGHPVFAVADGWVSRIKVSPWGFGHAIYITHNNGYTSVYAHLESFNEGLSQLLLDEQYKRKSFSVDMYLKKGVYPVKQSDLIAFSGNTGGSGGPHLHFELRETVSQKPINPLQFNFDIEDTIPPTFKALVAYNQSDKKFFTPIFSKGDFWIKDTVEVNDNFEIGIVTKDKSNNSDNRLGVNKIDYYLNDILMYSYKNESFSYSETRYANAHIDYGVYKTKSIRIQKMFVDPGNHLSCYSVLGKYKQINCNDFVKGRIEIQDSKNNKSVLRFIVKRLCTKSKEMEMTQSQCTSVSKFKYNEDNRFKSSDIDLYIPKGALYSDIDFCFQKSENSDYIGGYVYSIHRETTALHKKMTLKIKRPKIKDVLSQKLIIVKKNNKNIKAKKTTLDGVFLKTRIKELGDYTIAIDTLSPRIKFESFSLDSSKSFLEFSISDNLSGISSYNGYIDGQWVLFQYDYKTKRLFYRLDKHLRKENKNRNVLIKVSDAVGNVSSFKYTVKY